MRIPLVSNLRELDSSPRKFLLFTVFNVISWQCIVGQSLILLARKIDMPESWVGSLISFVPLSMLAIVLTVPLVVRFGPKRLLFTGWLVRNLFASVVLVLPWTLAGGSIRTAWYVLMAGTLGFCLTRAVGSGGWFPWLHEVVPEHQRGAFFSAETSVANLVNVGVALGQGLLLQGDPSVERFVLIYAIGVGSGFVSLFWMLRVPGGHGAADAREAIGTAAAYRATLDDRGYVVFVLVAALGFSSMGLYGSAVTLYLRDALHFASRTIMLASAVSSLGILLTIRFWARFAEHSGSGRAMFKTLFGHSAAALMIVFCLPGGGTASTALVFAAATATAVFGAAFYMAAHRAMLNYVHAAARVGYTNVWTVGTSLILGLTPIAVGNIIEHLGLWGYRVCFIASAAAGLLCGLACLVVVRDGPAEQEPVAGLLNPAMPVRTLARVAWITLGLHESNRPDLPPSR